MPPERLSIRYYRHDGTVLIRAIGPVVQSTSSHLIRPILALLKKGITSLVLDLTGVSAMDASGIETLQEASDLVASLDQPPLRLVVRPGSRVDYALKAADVVDNFRIYVTAEEAWSDSAGVDPGSSPKLEEIENAYLSVSREQEGDVTVFHMDGELDIEDVRDLKEILLRDLHAGNTKMVLDMHLVRFVDSSALGLFARIGHQLREAGGDLRFARLSEQCRRVFSVFRLEQAYRCFETVKGAVESYRIQQP